MGDNKTNVKDTKKVETVFENVYDYDGLLENFKEPLHYPDREEEVFKVIDIYGIAKNKYVISSYGRVFNMSRGIVLQPDFRDSYKTVRLIREDKEYCDYYIHDLVAYSFIKGAKDLIHQTAYVKHLNEIRSCNYVKNLIIVMTKKEAHTTKFTPFRIN